MLCFIAGLFGFVLSGFSCSFKFIQLGQNAVQPLIIVGTYDYGRSSMTLSGMPSLALMRNALDLPGTPTLSL